MLCVLVCWCVRHLHVVCACVLSVCCVVCACVLSVCVLCVLVEGDLV